MPSITPNFLSLFCSSWKRYPDEGGSFSPSLTPTLVLIKTSVLEPKTTYNNTLSLGNSSKEYVTFKQLFCCVSEDGTELRGPEDFLCIHSPLCPHQQAELLFFIVYKYSNI